MTITNLSGQLSGELLAFANQCSERIARGLHGISNWELWIASSLDGQTDAVVRAQVGAQIVEAKATAFDPAMAIWEAMCDVEQPLRDTVARSRAA